MNEDTQALFEGIAKSDKFTVEAAHKAFADLSTEHIIMEDNKMTQHQASQEK